MSFDWTRTNEEDLVEAWKTKPALFDTECQKYSSRTEKENAFQEIAELIGTTGKTLNIILICDNSAISSSSESMFVFTILTFIHLLNVLPLL